MQIIIKLYLISLLTQMSMALELKDQDLLNIYACERTNTGIALYKNSISKLISTISNTSTKTSVSLINSNLTLF